MQVAQISKEKNIIYNQEINKNDYINFDLDEYFQRVKKVIYY